MAKHKRKHHKSSLFLFFTSSIVLLVLSLYVTFVAILFLLFTFDLLSPDKPFFSLPFLATITFSSIFGIILSIYITKIIYRPINQMTSSFKKISKGNFNIKIQEDSMFDEINELYTNFNTMTSELSTIETLRNDFVVSVSHELKTPLTTIEGYATLLQDNELDQETKMVYTEKIIQTTRELSKLTGNILALSKLEHQELITDIKTFHLDEQIKQVLINLEPNWSKKNIEFDLDLDETLYSTNEGLSHQVWYNIINNAIKFSNDGGIISISIKKDESNIVVTIADNGIGMNEETQKHIFDKFYQGDTSHKSEGNGLGLSLVKRIIQLLNGKIFVTSKINEGSKFEIALPIIK